MAFHVACPITCRRICFCPLGFPQGLRNVKAKNEFIDDVFKVEEFLKDPLGIRVREPTVQVLVPKVVPPPPPPVQTVGIVGDAFAGADAADELAAAMSAQTKRIVLQRKAAAAMVAAEDYARRFESGNLPDASGSLVAEEQGQSGVNVMCRICFFGENEASEKARKMLSCKSCGKKYHRSCLKSWSQHRDLFHWSSWTCPSCRACEICRRTGDPNKFMFCKRCDGAYHCYCQHPPHKNVSSGPYLCPKHTRCHSCGSNVPGNGQSVRWFLGYTFCDACGRLFVKGNYCPVCLKVYRDSESTPMVCCDICQRWVHCHCDSISDEKYLQFQIDGNLQYKCTACRGQCYQVKNLEDAVQEIWRRKDEDDRGLIVSLRAAAGLPTQEEIFSISPYSDDEENGPAIFKSEFGRSLKLSLKGVVDKLPKKGKDYGKKSSNKKYAKEKSFQTPLANQPEGHNDTKQYGFGVVNEKDDGLQPQYNEGPDTCSSPIAGSPSHNEGMCSINQPGVLKHKFVDEVMVSDEERTSRVVQIRDGKGHGLDSGEDAGKYASKSKAAKGKKLVINLGARKINVANSPKSDASSCQREQDLITSNGSKGDHSGQSKGLKDGGTERNLTSFGKVTFGASDMNSGFGRGNTASGCEVTPSSATRVFSRKRNVEGSKAVGGSQGEVSTVREEKVLPGKQFESRSGICSGGNDDSGQTHFPQSLPRESKPLLKFKFKKPTLENQISYHEEEKSLVKGQRSKRKRPSPLMEKTSFNEVEDVARSHKKDNLLDEIMDANWILKKLGKDAIGKRVEVHHPSDKSWQKGVVSEMIDDTSTLSVTLDDGRVKILELGKQGIRFVPQKQKRSKS